jgi:RNA polymerase sigma-70 factor (ECF subfamily)
MPSLTDVREFASGVPMLTDPTKFPAAMPDGNSGSQVTGAAGDHDGDTIEGIYLQHRSQLAAYFKRRCRSQEEAAELLQETFLRVLRVPAERLRNLDSPGAYLSTIAGNLLRDRFKAEARRKAAYDAYARERLSTGPDEFRRLEARDMIDRLESAMRGLRPKTREIFMAQRLDGLTYAEIAERTGLSVKTVEKHMSRAIAHFDRVRSRGS